MLVSDFPLETSLCLMGGIPDSNPLARGEAFSVHITGISDFRTHGDVFGRETVSTDDRPRRRAIWAVDTKIGFERANGGIVPIRLPHRPR